MTMWLESVRQRLCRPDEATDDVRRLADLPTRHARG